MVLTSAEVASTMQPSSSKMITSSDQKRQEAVNRVNKFKKGLGTEMNEIIPHLFLGSLRDATDVEQLRKNRIKHIVSVHDLSSIHPLHKNLHVLRIRLSDCPSSDISVHFITTNEFIHRARIRGESVVVHCLAGVSRSATVVAAYLMTVCDLSFFNAISFMTSRRSCVNPNFGFRMQLVKYAEKPMRIERQRLRELFGDDSFDLQWKRDRTAVHSKIVTQCNYSSSPQLGSRKQLEETSYRNERKKEYSATNDEILSNDHNIHSIAPNTVSTHESNSSSKTRRPKFNPFSISSLTSRFVRLKSHPL